MRMDFGPELNAIGHELNEKIKAGTFVPSAKAQNIASKTRIREPSPKAKANPTFKKSKVEPESHIFGYQTKCPTATTKCSHAATTSFNTPEGKTNKRSFEEFNKDSGPRPVLSNNFRTKGISDNTRPSKKSRDSYTPSNYDSETEDNSSDKSCYDSGYDSDIKTEQDSSDDSDSNSTVESDDEVYDPQQDPANFRFRAAATVPDGRVIDDIDGHLRQRVKHDDLLPERRVNWVLMRIRLIFPGGRDDPFTHPQNFRFRKPVMSGGQVIDDITGLPRPLVPQDNYDERRRVNWILAKIYRMDPKLELAKCRKREEAKALADQNTS